MQITQVITFLAVAIAGAIAAPGGPPPPPPPPPPAPTTVSQQISCSGNASPYCCSPNAGFGGTTCTALVGGSVNCNGVVICCNNNGSNFDNDQSCFGSISGPVSYN